MNWDDLRIVCAVAAAGSLSRAAAALKVSQPTVGRRIRELETALDAKLFDRLACGYALTGSGRRLLFRAQEIERAVKLIADEIGGEASAVAGDVRITASEGIGAVWLAPRLRKLRARHPDLRISLDLSLTPRDLSAGEADIAVRMGDPGDESLVGRKIASAPFAIYAARDHLAEFGAPRDRDDLRRHAIIESSGALESVAQACALRHLAAGSPTALALGNIFAQVQAARSGIGLVGLPCYMAAAEPLLAPVMADEFDVELPVWCLTRADLRETARVRAVMDFIVSEAAASPELGGAPVRRIGHSAAGEEGHRIALA